MQMRGKLICFFLYLTLEWHVLLFSDIRIKATCHKTLSVFVKQSYTLLLLLLFFEVKKWHLKMFRYIPLRDDGNHTTQHNTFEHFKKQLFWRSFIRKRNMFDFVVFPFSCFQTFLGVHSL